MPAAAFLGPLPGRVGRSARHHPQRFKCSPARREVVCATKQEPDSASPKYEFKKVRQHVNPLANWHQRDITVSEQWPVDVYADVNKPLHVDIGSASGGFALETAAIEPAWNVLGLEIRTALVERAKYKATQRGLTNLEFIYSNANVNLDEVLGRFPEQVLGRVTVLFPDPWFKKRQHKRRVVQPGLVKMIAKYLIKGGEVILHSDVLDTADAMRQCFLQSPSFAPESVDWEPTTTLKCQTEREALVTEEGGSIYRCRFRRV